MIDPTIFWLCITVAIILFGMFQIDLQLKAIRRRLKKLEAENFARGPETEVR